MMLSQRFIDISAYIIIFAVTSQISKYVQSKEKLEVAGEFIWLNSYPIFFLVIQTRYAINLCMYIIHLHICIKNTTAFSPNSY